MDKYSERTAAYLETFLEKEGYRLLKTEFVKEDGNFYLRAYIDLTDEERRKRAEEKNAAPETDETGTETAEEAAEETAEETFEAEEEEPAEPGIGINDCAMVSRRLSKWLDKEDFIAEAYTLEVCSRGYLTEEVND